MDLKIQDSVVLVTGASRGLGNAISKYLVDEGAFVVAAARSKSDLEELAKYSPERVHPVVCDMANKNEVSLLVDKAIDKFECLDAVVNNAGMAPAENFLESDIATMEMVLSVNLIAPAVIAKAAANYFISENTNGSIVNIASTSGLKGKASLVSYSSSKGALLRFTESLAAEWARHGIRVNAIAPGAFVTSAQSAVLENENILTARLKKIPQRRMGDPEEIGPLTAYLVSPLSGFVTGSCFVIDGGEVSKL
ncbi:MAG: 2-deoxy-D-gluconate 3-dehydrogenase [Acidimicrobiaceae bacterium]|nr:2-deoxy-D-gluconate 3-dehydrogenase [Acidimicrobiaceae bacterium]